MCDDVLKIGVAGVGALGSIVCRELLDGIDGYELAGISEIEKTSFDVPNMTFEELAEKCDIVVECLPARVAVELARIVLKAEKELVMISASATVLFPEIIELAKENRGKIVIPSGAICGVDGVAALACDEIAEAKIVTTKPPKGLKNAPYMVENGINTDEIREKRLIFSGSAREAAKAFPANVNVAATLSLAGIGVDKTIVEIWADPKTVKNSHEITVKGRNSVITSKVENSPDPSNPKSSVLAAYSIISYLRKRVAKIGVV